MLNMLDKNLLKDKEKMHLMHHHLSWNSIDGHIEKLGLYAAFFILLKKNIFLPLTIGSEMRKNKYDLHLNLCLMSEITKKILR